MEGPTPNACGFQEERVESLFLVVALPDLRRQPDFRLARTNCHRGSSVPRLFYPFDYRNGKAPSFERFGPAAKATATSLAKPLPRRLGLPRSQ